MEYIILFILFWAVVATIPTFIVYCAQRLEERKHKAAAREHAEAARSQLTYGNARFSASTSQELSGRKRRGWW